MGHGERITTRTRTTGRASFGRLCYDAVMARSTRSRPGTCRALVVLLAGIFAALDAAGAPDTLLRTHPDHLRPAEPMLESPTESRLSRPQPPQDRTVYRLPWRRDEMAKHGARLDRDLSALCRRGRFQQRTDGMFRASLADGWVGLAFADGRNLKDDAAAARPGVAYLFEQQDTSACTVWTVRAQTIEQYQSGARRP